MRYARDLDSRLKNSNPTAHAAIRLVLLGSPPDTVRGAALRGTDLSSLLIQGRRHIARPGAGIHPRCSGLRVQGTAISPTSAALRCAETENRTVNIVLYPAAIINQKFSAFSLIFLCGAVPLAFFHPAGYTVMKKKVIPCPESCGSCWPCT